MRLARPEDLPRRRAEAHPPRCRRVLVEDWDTFYAEAEKLYVEHPDHTRYVAKYRHCDGKLELKVTNDRVCLKYVTDQQQDLKRIEKLNNLFLTYMCGKDPNADPAEGAFSTARAPMLAQIKHDQRCTDGGFPDGGLIL